MNKEDFNSKYCKYLEPRHYGLAINNQSVIEYLDKEFTLEIEVNPKFSYSQIKQKFEFVYVYTNTDKGVEWGNKIQELLGF